MIDSGQEFFLIEFRENKEFYIKPRGAFQSDKW
jgi:hypothetical protein